LGDKKSERHLKYFKGGIGLATFKCPDCKNQVSDQATSCPKCGRPFSREESHRLASDGAFFRKLSFGTIIVGVMAWIIISFVSPSSTKAPPVNLEGDPLEAFVMSQFYVEQNLKAPRSAKFPLYDKSMAAKTDYRVWVIRSHVDSQNSYGAMIRTRYKAVMEYLGEEGKWELRGLEFY